MVSFDKKVRCVDYGFGDIFRFNEGESIPVVNGMVFGYMTDDGEFITDEEAKKLRPDLFPPPITINGVTHIY